MRADSFPKEWLVIEPREVPPATRNVAMNIHQIPIQVARVNREI